MLQGFIQEATSRQIEVFDFSCSQMHISKLVMFKLASLFLHFGFHETLRFCHHLPCQSPRSHDEA